MLKPEIFATAEHLHHAAADLCVNRCSAAIATQGAFHLALSGGTTPKALFRLLASMEYRQQINWENVHVYFGDERFVPHNHNDSNYKMAKDTLLDNVPCRPENIHPIDTAVDSAQTAAAFYSKTLTTHLPKNSQGRHEFDLILLGLGPDGHTASLFPDTLALKEMDKICTAVFVEKFNSWRITMTYPIINAAKEILLLSEGEGKANIVYDLLITEKDTTRYPVQRIKPAGRMSWFIDEAATKKLT